MMKIFLFEDEKTDIIRGLDAHRSARPFDQKTLLDGEGLAPDCRIDDSNVAFEHQDKRSFRVHLDDSVVGRERHEPGVGGKPCEVFGSKPHKEWDSTEVSDSIPTHMCVFHRRLLKKYSGSRCGATGSGPRRSHDAIAVVLQQAF